MVATGNWPSTVSAERATNAIAGKVSPENVLFLDLLPTPSLPTPCVPYPAPFQCQRQLLLTLYCSTYAQGTPNFYFSKPQVFFYPEKGLKCVHIEILQC